MAPIEPHGPDTPGLLTPVQVAAILQVSPRTVRRLSARGLLAGVRLGHRTVRYTPESVQTLTCCAYNGDASDEARADRLALNDERPGPTPAARKARAGRPDSAES